MNLITKKHHPVNSIFDHFFNHSIGDFIGSDFVNSQPAVNIVEREKGFRIELAAPGLTKEDFKISTEKNALKIAVEKKEDVVNENEKFTRREFGYRSFERKFNLGDKVNVEDISANYELGILSITLPKKKEAIAVKRQIEIS